MAYTTDGLPYPVGTDLVRDGDNVIAALANSITQLGRWIKAGRVDTTIEGNGNARIPRALSFPSDQVPAAIVATGIDHRFVPKWGGLADGSGVLLPVYDEHGAIYAAGYPVAFYFICFRPFGP